MIGATWMALELCALFLWPGAWWLNNLRAPLMDPEKLLTSSGSQQSCWISIFFLMYRFCIKNNKKLLILYSIQCFKFSLGKWHLVDSERHSKRAAASWEPLSDCLSVLLWKIDFAIVFEVSHCSSCDFLASNILFTWACHGSGSEKYGVFILVTVTNVILLNPCFVQLLNCIHFVIEYFFQLSKLWKEVNVDKCKQSFFFFKLSTNHNPKAQKWAVSQNGSLSSAGASQPSLSVTL